MHLYEQIEELRRQQTRPSETRKPILLLDIDDTLIDCRHRKHKVFMDFIAQAEVRRTFSTECDQLAALSPEAVRYRVHDNLKSLQIKNQEFAAALFDFWRQHYFTFPYLIQDQAFPGAVPFVERSHRSGLALVYLTGRDQAGMGRGTFESLTQLGFPTQGPDIHFMLKPDVNMGDFEFKRLALEEVAQLGPVIAAFENELGNLNAMAQRFPEAAVYWRKTLYAPDPPEPHERVQILFDFPSPPL